jgi:photosystem II stability/assembly factor-like uncharacterized protein
MGVLRMNATRQSRFSSQRTVVLVGLLTLALVMAPGVAFAGTNKWTRIGTPPVPTGWTESAAQLRSAISRCRIVLSPAYASDHTLFLALDKLSETEPSALLRTTDGGANWTQLPLPSGFLRSYGDIRIAVSPAFASDHTVFAFGAGDTGIWKSTNSGSSWTPLSPAAGWTIMDSSAHYDADTNALAFSPAFSSDRTVFAVARANELGAPEAIRSTDGGATWNALVVNPGLNPEETPEGLNLEWVAVSPGFATDRTVFVGGTSVWRSTDGGDTWAGVSMPAFFESAAGCITMSPAYATDETLFVRDLLSGCARSTDGGATWTRTTAPAESAVVISPGFAADRTVFAGLSRSSDGGTTWEGFDGAFQIYADRTIQNVAVPSTYASDSTVLGVVNGYLCEYTFAAKSAPKLTLARSSWRSNRFKGVLYRWADFKLKVYPPTTSTETYLRTERYSGGAWKKVENARMSWHGVSGYDVIDAAWVSYDHTCPALKPGRYRFRARFGGDGGHTSANTAWQYVTLR